MKTRLGRSRPAGRWRSAVWLVVCAAWLAVPCAAHAHKVTVFAWVDGDRVVTESKFSRGRMVKQGRIVVYDLQGEKLLEGETDEQGRFSFPLPGNHGLRVELEAGAGHRAEWTLDVGPAANPGESGTPALAPRDSYQPVDTPGAEEIRQAVEKALDAKLDPVIRMLLEARDPGPSVTEVVGGIGYIVGLAGLALFLQDRRRRNGPGSS